jgi:hypothetical protein
MTFLQDLKSCLGRDSDLAASAAEINSENPLFVYVRMPGDLDPIDRHERFGDPLDEALAKEQLGCVTGGGSQFDAPDDDGDCEVVFCGLDVDLYHVEKGLALLSRELIRLQVPLDTVLLYELGGREWQDPVYATPM